MKKTHRNRDLIEYQPNATEINEQPVPGKARWVLYLLFTGMLLFVVAAIIFKVDRIVVAHGELMTSSPTLVVQSLNTAIIRTIEVRVGDVVEKDQTLATLDSTFAAADLSQLEQQQSSLTAQIRRIRAELEATPFTAGEKEGQDGKLQEQVFRQRQLIHAQYRRMTEDKIAALQAKLRLNSTQRQGLEHRHKLLRDVEGTVAKQPQQDHAHRLRLLEAQQARFQVATDLDSLRDEEALLRSELRQAESDWQRFVEERRGDLLEQEVRLHSERQKVEEELNKAKRMHELIALRAPEKGVVLKILDRSVGSILQQAEPFIILVPHGSLLEAEVEIESKDIGRVRTGDVVRIKLDAFPFQRYDTLPGRVRIISENAFQHGDPNPPGPIEREHRSFNAFYRTRITLLSTRLRNIPDGFRLLPGMRVRAEIKVGQRSVVSYFLYPILRSLDESLREP